MPAPLCPFPRPSSLLHGSRGSVPGSEAPNPYFPLPDFRVTPHYPTKSPLDDVLRLVAPGSDEYVTEKYAFEILQGLNEWGRNLKAVPPALDVLAKLLGNSLEAITMTLAEETRVRTGYGIDVVRRKFASGVVVGRERFLQSIKAYLASLGPIETAEFEITGIEEVSGTAKGLQVEIRYDFVGTRPDKQREERIGRWLTQWSYDESGGWRASRWEATEETLSRAREAVFVDVTAQALGGAKSYESQMLPGVDHWRTVLDGACGIDVYGNNGLALGDFDNDGWDDLYVCQPAGLPNRLYRNRGDGTFEDVTEKAGVGVLDGTASALFVDFENRGLQDLLVVCGSGPLLFRNQGNGTFALLRDAFQFARPPAGTFTHAAVADYDGDGRLDIYFCVYSYYLGLDQYHYPVPYFDARNGPPNFLLHNEGNGRFLDRTEAAGLNVDNDRYSFACAWSASDAGGRPDLYVANDFGRSNLYRNNGDGTFASVATEAGVEDAGAGMSACWCDFDNDGRQDIYVANMWSSAGMRVSQQRRFHENEPEQIRALYRRHASGNSLYQNLGNGKFRNESARSGVEMGRWAWCSDAWDFDHDGYADLYVSNGYISGPGSAERDASDVSSFFWRQVVAKSPPNSTASPNYERGWNAINELIRSDASWNGHERNVFYANNRDGTFSEVSGTVRLDFPEDGRSFGLADLDHDGRLEVVLKNRNSPQLRILRNAMKEIGGSIAFRLRGTKSNRDAIGALVAVEVGPLRQTKYLQAGSGFLAQHTKDLSFGIGKGQATVRVSIRWPSGLVQAFEHVPVNQRIEIEEGSENFVAKEFAAAAPAYLHGGDAGKKAALPSSVETWLIEPLKAPEFSLPDLAGKMRELRSFSGSAVLLYFWAVDSSACNEQVEVFQKHRQEFVSGGMAILGINVDDDAGATKARSLAARYGASFSTLFGTEEMIGVYNIIYRYLFDRRRNLGVPTSFLVDAQGMIVKVYQGAVKPERVLLDSKSIPRTPAERMGRALPFEGVLCGEGFQRNDFTYGVAMFQRGYLAQASSSFQNVIASNPDNAEAHYNLGTLYLRQNDLARARQSLEETVKLRPGYPEAWNNLGMIAAQSGNADEAVRNFQESLRWRPYYAIALLNLGNVYRRQGNFDGAEQLLSRALRLEPDNPEVSYNLGMLYARMEKLPRATQYLEKAVNLRPDYADALNNLGVLLVRQEQYSAAKERFETCIRVAPSFDQAYLNLARLYIVLKDKEKAKDVLRALLRLQPGHKMAQQALEMLN